MYIGYAFRVLTRWVWLLLIGACVGVLIGLGAHTLLSSYTTTAQLILVPLDAEASVRAVQPERFFRTQTERLLGDPLLSAAAGSLTDGTTTGQLREAVSVDGGVQSDVLSVTARGATSEQSADRLRALLDAVGATPSLEQRFDTLWVGTPTSSLSRSLALAMGAAGGLAATALALLLWAAIRRPLLDPRYVELSGVSARVFPQIISRADDTEKGREFLGWLTADDQTPGPLSVHVIRLGAAARDFPFGSWLGSSGRDQVRLIDNPLDLESLERNRCVIVVLATMGKASEWDAEERILSVQHLAQRSVLLLVKPSRSAGRRIERSIDNA